MLKLYVKDGHSCPYCQSVRDTIAELGIEGRVEQVPLTDPDNAEELVDLGGEKQVPFLLDEERNVRMYESADINAYLRETYGVGGIEQEDIPPRDERDSIG